jgi:hypothetical protein
MKHSRMRESTTTISASNGKLLLYYVQETAVTFCCDRCKKKMPLPAKRADLKGTWACNGTYHWRCYSSGKDTYASRYPNVPARNTTEHQGIPGSAELYSYRGMATQLTNDWPVTVEAKFMPCYCRKVAAIQL